MVRMTTTRTLLVAVLLVLMSSIAARADWPARQRKTTGDVKQAPAQVHVWLNSQTGVFHCRGSQYWGAPNGGETTQAEAIKRGARPARGRYCLL